MECDSIMKAFYGTVNEGKALLSGNEIMNGKTLLEGMMMYDGLN